MSSESDTFNSTDESPHTQGRQGSTQRGLSTKVEKLASTLQETNKNLQDVDRMLIDYKQIGDKQSGAINKLKRDLEKTREKLEEEKYQQSLKESARPLRASDLRGYQRRKPTSPLEDYVRATVSDQEYTDKRKSQINVRFFDDMSNGDHVHSLHQSLRDLASGQMRLEDDMNREIDHRNRFERDSTALFSDLKDSLRIPEAMQGVEKRLKEIQEELRSERLTQRKWSDDGKISPELQSALSEQNGFSSTGPAYYETRSQVQDQHKQQLERELETVRRRLDLAEGGRDAVSQQIDNLRQKLAKSDRERYRLNALLEAQDADTRERQKQRAVDDKEREKWVSEKNHMENELKTMRSQLTKSVAAMGDYTDLREVLDKSERQRDHLSEHILVLKKEMDEKEKDQMKVIQRLQETSEKLQDSERSRHQALLQLEDTLKRLRDMSHDAEQIVADNRNKHKLLEEGNRQREEMKARAQETIRQWKVKCKKLERDLDRQQHTAQQATQRSEELIKQLEALNSRTHASTQQVDHFKRELAELLAIRAQQDEQVRVKDVESNELRALKMDLERDLRDCKHVIERLEQELRSANDKNMQLYDEKVKFEDQLGAVQTGQVLVQNQMQQMQKELKEVSLEKVELAGQLAEVAKERNELRLAMQEARKGEAAAREEIGVLMKRLQEEKDFHATRLEATNSKLEQYKVREAHIIQEMTRRFNKEQTECQAQLHALKIELQEEKSSNKLQKKNLDKLKHEVDKLHKQLVKSQEDNEKYQNKYYKIREEYITKTQITEDDIGRAKDMELQLVDSREKLKQMEKDFQNILYSIHAEVNALVEVVAFDSLEVYKAVGQSRINPDEPAKWLAELKSKLEWVKNEFREKRFQEARNQHDVYQAEEIAVSTLHRAGTRHRKHTAERDVDEEINKSHEGDHKSHEVNFPEEELLRSLKLEEENQQLQEEVLTLTDSKKERDMIHERYAKLQETISVLKQDLLDAKSTRQAEQGVAKSTKVAKRVRIAPVPLMDSTYEADESTMDETNHSLSPLRLTDEEFARRFIPRTPEPL